MDFMKCDFINTTHLSSQRDFEYAFYLYMHPQIGEDPLFRLQGKSVS